MLRHWVQEGRDASCWRGGRLSRKGRRCRLSEGLTPENRLNLIHRGKSGRCCVSPGPPGRQGEKGSSVLQQRTGHHQPAGPAKCWGSREFHCPPAPKRRRAERQLTRPRTRGVVAPPHASPAGLGGPLLASGAPCWPRGPLLASGVPCWPRGPLLASGAPCWPRGPLLASGVPCWPRGPLLASGALCLPSREPSQGHGSPLPGAARDTHAGQSSRRPQTHAHAHTHTTGQPHPGRLRAALLWNPPGPAQHPMASDPDSLPRGACLRPGSPRPIPGAAFEGAEFLGTGCCWSLLPSDSLHPAGPLVRPGPTQPRDSLGPECPRHWRWRHKQRICLQGLPLCA